MCLYFPYYYDSSGHVTVAPWPWLRMVRYISKSPHLSYVLPADLCLEVLSVLSMVLELGSLSV